MNNLTSDVNAKCNIECEFCYQDLDGSELSLDDVINQVETGLKIGKFDVVEIGGGEPFMYKPLLQLMAKLADLGKKANISTNATFIPKGLLELEQRVRDNTTIQASLHASNPKLYKEITKRDLFDNVIANIKKIKEKYQTLISTAVYDKNLDDVPNILHLAYSLDLPIRINLVIPEGNGKNVKLLNKSQVNTLRGLLFVEKIKHQGQVDSPLLHENTCYALAQGYGIEKKGLCPIDLMSKLYLDPRKQKFACEFYRKPVEAN